MRIWNSPPSPASFRDNGCSSGRGPSGFSSGMGPRPSDSSQKCRLHDFLKDLSRSLVFYSKIVGRSYAKIPHRCKTLYDEGRRIYGWNRLLSPDYPMNLSKFMINCATSALVAVFCGARVPSPMPLIRPLSVAQIIGAFA